MSRGVEFIKTIIERGTELKTFERCLKSLKLISAGNGCCKAEFIVESEHLNGGGSLHGGFTSTLVDSISTYALMTQGSGAPGVSVDLHVTFMKAAFPGEKVTIDARTIRAGRTLAFLAVDLTKEYKGKTEFVAKGCQTKFLGGGNNSS